MSPPPLPVLNGVDGTEPLDDLRALFAAGDAALRAFFGAGPGFVASDPASVGLSKNTSSSSMFALRTSSTQTLEAGDGKKPLALTSTGW